MEGMVADFPTTGGATGAAVGDAFVGGGGAIVGRGRSGTAGFGATNGTLGEGAGGGAVEAAGDCVTFGGTTRGGDSPADFAGSGSGKRTGRSPTLRRAWFMALRMLGSTESEYGS